MYALDVDLKNKSLEQRQSLLSLRSLQDAATKLADLKNVPNGLNTRALVGMFICQTQRNKRIAMDPVRIHLRVATRQGSSIVKLRFGSTKF
ncbi:hypothetical protein [Bartonella tamiae]|uniref:Uncharacterized protein n=1 Tax=Bartonella tamiae Th239 TaxID=1094558 RepID=J0QZF9_9HYPH|nr:hypothetical protein [Bartonella tamiae]EJF88619.1 hypothetical protein ME5_01170 [Bartonella tamiae Th239]EJF95131.1 hypothetical protein MEG_00712 [Bartonella tamiae Th307]